MENTYYLMFAHNNDVFGVELKEEFEDMWEDLRKQYPDLDSLIRPQDVLQVCDEKKEIIYKKYTIIENYRGLL